MNTWSGEGEEPEVRNVDPPPHSHLPGDIQTYKNYLHKYQKLPNISLCFLHSTLLIQINLIVIRKIYLNLFEIREAVSIISCDFTDIMDWHVD